MYMDKISIYKVYSLQEMKAEKIGVLLILHGSRDRSCRGKIIELKNALAKLTSVNAISVGFMQFTQPSINDGLNELITSGCNKILVLPLFVTYGLHLREGIPKILGIEKPFAWNSIKLSGKEVSVYYCLDPLINSHLFSQMVADKIIEAFNKLNLKPYPNEVEGEEIFDRSIQYIKTELGDFLRKISENEGKLIIRAVHAAGDLGIAKLIVISENAIESGVRSIKSGKNVFTDVKMVAAGINKRSLSKFNCKIFCYIDDDRVSNIAHELKVTRSSAAVILASEEGILEESIAVIGNSPTALMTLIEKVEEGAVKPALIIATPVGFINAVESKKRLMKTSIPYITLLGTKGGSSIATSIFNGVVEICEERAS